MSDAPDILGESRHGGYPLNEELSRNIEAIRVYETLVERIAIAFAAVEYIHGSNGLHVHSKYGPKSELNRASFEVLDLLEFIPGIDARIDPDGRRRSKIMWRVPQSVGGSGWMDTSNFRMFLGTILFVIHNDHELHVTPDVDVETGNPVSLADHNEVPEAGISVCQGGAMAPEAAPCCLSTSVEIDCHAVTRDVPNPGLVGPVGLPLRELVAATANSPSSPMGDSLSLDRTRARKILAFPVSKHRSVSDFKSWIHRGDSSPRPRGVEPHVVMPSGAYVSKASLDNLARLFQAGLGGGLYRRPRLVNTDESLGWTESDGDPSPHRLRLRNRGANYSSY